MQKDWISLLAELEYLKALGQQLIEQTDELLVEYSSFESHPPTQRSLPRAEHLEN